MNTTWRQAAQATIHCLTGCAIGEILGMVIATAIGLGNIATIVLATALAFTFGYALTMRSILKSGLSLKAAFGIALAADTISITIMEIVDNATIALIPRALDATLADPLFYWSLALGLTLAFFAAWPVNRRLISRGLGHAVVHEHMHHAHH